MKNIKNIFFIIVSSIGLVNSFALKPKVIIFDAGDTLIKVGNNYSVLINEAVQEKGWEVKPESKSQEVLMEVIGHHPEFLQIAEDFDDVEKIKKDFPELIKITKEWCQDMGYPYDDKNVTDLLKKIVHIKQSVNDPLMEGLFPKVHETLTQLKSEGYRLALLSNWDSSLRKLLKKYDIKNYFEAIVISGEVGFAKPDPRIFEKALHDLKVLKKDVVYVGDSLHDDIYGAKGAGIQPIWANYYAQPLPGDLSDVITISSIDELLNKVDR